MLSVALPLPSIDITIPLSFNASVDPPLEFGTLVHREIGVDSATSKVHKREYMALRLERS